MRVLHIGSTYVPYVGGATLRLKSFLEPMANAGIEVHLLVAMPPERFGRLPMVEVINGVTVHRVSSQVALVKSVLCLHKQWHFDIIHAHSFRHALVAAPLPLPLITELHSLRDFGVAKRVITRWLCARTAHIFVLAASARDELIRLYNVPPSKVEVLYNGVDTKRFDPLLIKGHLVRHRLGLSDCDPVIGYAGTFHSWQGVHLLAQAYTLALTRLPNLKLVMVGDGPEFPTIFEQMHDPVSNGQAYFPGMISPEDVPLFLAAMDVVAIVRPPTAETNSALPLKVLEAMCMERMVLVTPVHGLTEVVVHGRNGWISQSFEPRDIANDISNLFDASQLQRSIMGNNARRDVVARFSWSASLEQVLRAYKATTSL